MYIKDELQQKFEELERRTVSDSFGGEAIEGRAPVFAFKPIMHWAAYNHGRFEEPLSRNLDAIKNSMSAKCFKYTMECLGRFAFCIELTNLSITSTKMKTRWVLGRITKTRQGTFENFEGDFSPGQDERSSTFNECYSIFNKCIQLLANSASHRDMMDKLSDQKRSGTPYESVFTYLDQSLGAVHIASNIRLVELTDIEWLITARPLIKPSLRIDADGNKTKCVEKIATKCYKTDRSQTGEVQTNRAKRWECLNVDFQHATIEECWSVERKLLNDVAHFRGFPMVVKEKLIQSGLFGEQGYTLCPITLKPMIFEDLLGGGGHGESQFQVGHMMPLKAGGNHEGDNIEWISNDGNRIQGSLNIQETREMLAGIFERMSEKELI
ncbi:hypothetical protein [Vibrio sp. 10N.237.312.B06]|uniref:hypothetical protein n=1 Tax=Vibrio sp. 10N.237.312.B06 TaxID=3229974 RepID=UPI003552157E